LKTLFEDTEMIEQITPDRELTNDKPYSFKSVMYQYSYVLTLINSSPKDLLASDKFKSVEQSLSALSSICKSIKYDKIGSSHVFYPYHREIAEIMNATAHASYAIAQGTCSCSVNENSDECPCCVHLQFTVMCDHWLNYIQDNTKKRYLS